MGKFKIPADVMAAISNQVSTRTLQGAANFLVDGEFDQADEVPEAALLIVADALLTLSDDPHLEALVCAHCEKVRLEHPLESDGWRYCKGLDDSEGRRRFTPMRTVEEPQIITGDEAKAEASKLNLPRG